MNSTKLLSPNELRHDKYELFKDIWPLICQARDLGVYVNYHWPPKTVGWFWVRSVGFSTFFNVVRVITVSGFTLLFTEHSFTSPTSIFSTFQFLSKPLINFFQNDLLPGVYTLSALRLFSGTSRCTYQRSDVKYFLRAVGVGGGIVLRSRVLSELELLVRGEREGGFLTDTIWDKTTVGS